MSNVVHHKDNQSSSAQNQTRARHVGSDIATPGRAVPQVPRSLMSSRFGRRRGRSLGAVGTFFTMVLLPTIVSVFYFFAVASSQYASEFRFSVRSADVARNDASAMFQGMASASQIGLDSYVVVQYIRSRELIDKLRGDFDFGKAFGDFRIDWFSRLRRDATKEELDDYWNRHVDPFFDLTTGSVTVQVRAFSPADAQRLAQLILKHSETLVNDLSRRSRDDAVRGASDEVVRAEDRLRQALMEQRILRDTRGTINPEKEAEGGLIAVAKLREELAKANTDLSMHKDYLGEDSPTIRVTQSRIRALQNQIALAASRLTNRSSADETDSNVNRPLSANISDFDALSAERRFAEDNYKATLASLEKAREQANRQTTYFATFISPSLAQDALYPKRVQDVLITFLAALGVWIFFSLVFRGLRERG